MSEGGHADLGKPIPKKISVWDFVCSELTRGYLLERDETKYKERRQRVYTFMNTPRELEKFLINGFFHCTDAFLFIFTFLPLRILIALVRILTCPFGFLSSRIMLPIFGYSTQAFSPKLDEPVYQALLTQLNKHFIHWDYVLIDIISGQRLRSGNLLEPAQKCDLLKGVILVSCCFIINYIDTSMMYHLVRGQATIKLYVFFNMLEVCDKLFSSFGQDILDALFWTATEPKGRKREQVGVIPHLALAIIYVIIHTLLLLFQVTVLNVAFNSHNKALLTIMVSNNFVEIKGSLFRKMDEKNLFQISCSDVKERFHYIILLSVVFVRNMTEFSWNVDHVWVILPDAVLVLLAELVVDWIKHAFLTKFNEIPAEVYRRFTANLAEDLLQSRQKHAFTDHSDLVSRRMNFTPIPLAVLLWRALSGSLKLSGYFPILCCVIFYLCLFATKIIVSVIMIGRACQYAPQTATKDSVEKDDGQDVPYESQDIVHTTQPDLIREHSLSSGIIPNVTTVPKELTLEEEELDCDSVQSFFETDIIELSTDKITDDTICVDTISSALFETHAKDITDVVLKPLDTELNSENELQIDRGDTAEKFIEDMSEVCNMDVVSVCSSANQTEDKKNI